MNGVKTRVSIISSDAYWEGTILNEDEVRIEGRFEGTVGETIKVVIAASAHARGSIEAQVVTVAGELVGSVNCLEKLELVSTGQIKGKAITRSLTVEEGAFIDAALGMTKRLASSSANKRYGCALWGDELVAVLPGAGRSEAMTGRATDFKCDDVSIVGY